MDDALPEAVGDLLRRFAAQSREHALMYIGLDANIHWFSEGAEHIFGWKAEEIVGRPCATLFVPEDVAMGIPDHEREIALRGDAAEDDRYLQRKDGSRFWASGVLIPLRAPDGRVIGFGKALRNRTDMKEQIEHLRNRAEELDGALRRKDVFIATLSHELRNPLAPLANAVHIIRLAAPPSPDTEYALKVVERQMAVLQRLVDDLLDISRVGAGKVILQREPILLQELLREAAAAAGPAVDARRHRLDLVQAEGDILVEGDRERLHQVFVNLITNAAKYTPPGGHIWVKSTQEPDEAVVRVEDNGSGIPGDVLPRIFDLFTQVESNRAMAQGGLGIGLALVKDLVQLHGGSVQAKSDGPGKGSEFTVRLPLRCAPG
jgi:two-component system CheB/CheR fusion protein